VKGDGNGDDNDDNNLLSFKGENKRERRRGNYSLSS
jgi:hypothetical protein